MPRQQVFCDTKIWRKMPWNGALILWPTLILWPRNLILWPRNLVMNKNKIYLKVYCNLIDITMFTFAKIKKSMVSLVIWNYGINRISIMKPVPRPKGSVSVNLLRPKIRFAHTKHDVISILMNKYTYINMYSIKKIISCIFILCWDITAVLKQNRSTEGCSRLKRSVDMTSSGKKCLNIRTNASPKWDRTRCPEE